MKSKIYMLIAAILLLSGVNVIAGDLTDNGDGTVTDNNTGLMWQQGKPGAMNWEDAITYCENLSLAGYDDWRLANIKELRSIVDDRLSAPAIDTNYFPDAQASGYWSSTTNTNDASYAGFVHFDSGYVSYDKKPNTLYARCVRSGKIAVFDNFSTDTTGNFETYFWPDPRNVSPNSVELNYDSANQRAILEATGGYGRALMKRKDNSLISANTDFEFSVDFDTLNEFNSSIYLGELSNYWQNTHLIFNADNYREHSLSVQVNVEGETIFSDGIAVDNGTRGTLRMKRVNGVYSFYFNDELLGEYTIDELSGLSLYYGALNAITSGPSNCTAKSAFDNWDFKLW
ncbi:MAG: DUF1566 domain-containing protein [Armatimonadetes bacterium]|nr:DUF1566 domain-containing protein [Armatimonadota bacterium]